MEQENSAKLVICALKNQSIPTKNIAEELKIHGISYSERGINNVYQQFKQRGTHLTNRGNCGRKNIDSETEEEIVTHFKENQTSLRQFQKNKELNEGELTVSSIHRILHRNDLSSFQLGRVIHLTEEHKQERLQFAKKVARWKEKWKSIAFQDETHFEIENFGFSHTWAESKDSISSDLCRKRNSVPQKIYLLGIIHYEGGLKLFRVDQNLNYDTFIEYLRQSKEELEGKVICLDQAKFHTSAKTRQWLEDQNQEYLLLPPKGADINLIENIWFILKQEVFKKKEQIHSLDDLKTIAETEFYHSQKIKDSIRNAYQSIPKRIFTIIQKNGDLKKI